METQRGWISGVAVALLLLAGFALKGILIVPPAAPPAATGQFNTGRAFARLQRVLGDERAHPVDTAADDAVRERLIGELRAIGLSPRVQDATDCSAMPKSRAVSCSHVRNVIATIPSLHPGRQLLLNAHYDSTPTGPGAGDDGLGVAVLLEVGAILKATPPQRPVTLLFNEGEEFGLNGAHAFVRADPLAKQVDSLINIDVRGVTGPALMYETSDPNRVAIDWYARSTHRPYANSISTDFAKLIPNTTDVVFFKPLGWALLNYSIIGNETRYHSPGDNLAALDRDSLAHVGTEVLAATTAATTRAGAASGGSGRMVFTDVLGRGFLRLPLVVAGAALALLLLAASASAWKRKAFRRPLAASFAMLFGGIAASAFLSLLLGAIRPGDFWRAYPLVPYLANYAVLMLAMIVVQLRFGHIDRGRMRAAAWLTVLLVGACLSIALPGATIFFLIAPAVALLGIAFTTRSPHLSRILVVAASLIQFAMFSELLAEIEVLLIDGPLWAVAPLAALAVLPVLVEVPSVARRPANAALAASTLLFAIAALLMPRASPERPLAFGIEYYRDLAANKASWAISDKRAPLPRGFPGKWTSAIPEYTSRQRWLSPAPIVATPLPSVSILGTAAVNQGRRLRLAISLGGADAMTLRFGKDTKVLALGTAGAPIPVPARGEPDKPLLRCSGRSCDGLTIDVLLADRRPVSAELFATRFALPQQGKAFVGARPRDAQPQYAPDQTIVRTLVKL